MRVDVDADGHPGYLATARMLGEAGLLLAEPGATPERAGCLTPATALGTGSVERFERARVRFSVAGWSGKICDYGGTGDGERAGILVCLFEDLDHAVAYRFGLPRGSSTARPAIHSGWFSFSASMKERGDWR